MPISNEQNSLAVYGPLSRQYWAFQLAGWSAMALLSYLSLTIWYNPGELAPAFHTIVQSLLGIAVSHPLRWVATQSWQYSIARRSIVNGLAVLVASLVWTALRILTFTWITGEHIPPNDYGGWLFASVIVFGAWSFCYHALKYYRLSTEQKRLAVEAHNTALSAQAQMQLENFKRLEAEKLFRDAQLRMLKYQLNPHFILNALNSVSALVAKGSKHDAMDMLARIGDFLSGSLSNPEEVQHSLAEELEMIELYLGIEKVRFGDRMKVVFEVEDAALDAMVPSLLLQPLFENAIKFAVSKRVAPTTIRFSAGVSGNELHLQIADDGPGAEVVPGKDGASGQGIGLMNVRQRLESAYGNGFTLELSNAEPSGMVIDVKVIANLEFRPVPELATHIGE